MSHSLPMHLALPSRRRRVRSRRLLALLASSVAAPLLGFATSAASGASSVIGYWQSGASLITPTINATETLLANGLVLVAGGEEFPSGVSTAVGASELYNPTTGAWTATGSLNTPRINASAVLLQNGDVLIAGGENIIAGVPTPLASAELYNPSTGLWTATGALPSADFDGTLTLLASGKALIAGGENIVAGVTSSVSASALFNPAVGTWAATTTTLPTAESGGTATLLANGTVIVIGGENIASSIPTALSTLQLYDPSVGANGSWSTLTATLPTAEFGATASLLANGRVLLAGGETIASGDVTPLATSYLFDPSAVTVTATGSLTNARFDAGAAVLPNGVVLVAGGTGSSSGQLVTLSSAETYDPSSGTWTTTGSLVTAQSSLALIAQSNGGAIAVGGTSSADQPVANLETFSVGVAPNITSASATTFSSGSAGTFTITAAGTPTPSFTESGTLPNGVTFTDEGNGSALLSGTPNVTSSTVFDLTISASNPTGLSASQSFSLTVTVASTTTTATSATTIVPSRTTTVPGNASTSVAGYLLARADGSVFGHGQVSFVQPSPRGPVAAIASTPDRRGYWTVTRRGQIFNIGDAGFYGSPIHVRNLAPIVGMAVTSDGKGYWLLTGRGNVYSYGDARFFGSVAGRRQLLPAAAIAASPTAAGYWIVGKNGVVTGFGAVHSYGGTPGHQAAVAITSSPSGNGYYLVTAAGNVFNLGDARFFGSLARRHHLPAISAMAADFSGTGYYLLSDTGIVYPFGAALSFGSTSVRPSSPMIGIALTS